MNDFTGGWWTKSVPCVKADEKYCVCCAAEKPKDTALRRVLPSTAGIRWFAPHSRAYEELALCFPL
jgi:hypothetical protein